MKKEYFALRIIAVALVTVLVVSLAVFSAFSWYDRTQRNNETGNKIEYIQTGKVNNASGISVVTYAGIEADGVIEYSDTPLDGGIDVKSGKNVHFKTVITDTANAGGAVVSLYIKDLTYTSGLGANPHIGIICPEKTYKEINTKTVGGVCCADVFCLEDNIIVENNGTVEIQWFIKPTVSITLDDAIKLGEMCIAYN